VLGEVLRWHEDGRAVSGLWKAAIEAGGPGTITTARVRPGTYRTGAAGRGGGAPLPLAGEEYCR
jgi:hypothetical protein